MKPDGACGGDMDGEDWLPEQLFQGLGFLVLEARTPHGATAKGRVEGPHCPNPQQGNTHLCCPQTKQCRRANLVRRQMELLWRNGIPMCIEVALYPDCSHGWLEADSVPVEGGASAISAEENRILLERWNIHVMPKRHSDKPERSVTPRFLLQAVRSHLHFSQLSAWLSSTKGQLPCPIAYRLFAPGESGWENFNSATPDVHSFPQADVSQITIKVSVEALPRLPQIPDVMCRYGNYLPLEGKHRHKNGNKSKPSGPTTFPTHKHCAHDESAKDSANNNTGRDAHAERTTAHGVTSAAPMHCPLVADPAEKTGFDQNANGATQVQSAKPKVKLKPLDLEAPPVSKSKTKGHNLLAQAKRKDSPKVLITSSSSTRQTFYRKRYIDFDRPDTAGEPGDWGSAKLSSHLQLPLYIPPRNAAEELEAYLATIAERNLWREEQLKHIPVTKCKFYIGDESDDFDDDNKAVPQKEQEAEEDIIYQKTPTLPIDKNRSVPQDDLCKNLFQQTFSNVQPNENENFPSGQSDLEELDQLDLVSELSSISLDVPSPSITNLPPSSGHLVQHLERDVTPEEKDHNCSPVLGTDAIDTRSNVTNGVKRDSVISNGAPVKQLPAPHGVPCSHNTPAISTTGEITTSLQKTMLQTKFVSLDQNGAESIIPSQRQISNFRESLGKSASMVFCTSTGLPSRSSPAPIKKMSSGKFDYDSSLTSTRAIKNAISCSKLSLKTDSTEDSDGGLRTNQTLSTSAPASTNSLLGNFEESVLNGRIEPIGVVEGFTAEIGASGAFCPKHITLPVTSYFFSLSDDNAPSPYLGHINLECGRRKGYHVPKAGTVQVTLFNPNKTVVKMFVVRYDLSDMPPNCQTFLRQRTLYTPVNKDYNNDSVEEDGSQPSFLRYLIHLRFVSSKTGKIHLHTDIRLIFARDKFEFDPRVANYELRSFTEGPKNPKFSPKR